MCTIFIYMPETNTELLYGILSIFIMTAVFGFVLNTIGVILSEINKKDTEFK